MTTNTEIEYEVRWEAAVVARNAGAAAKAALDTLRATEGAVVGMVVTEQSSGQAFLADVRQGAAVTQQLPQPNTADSGREPTLGALLADERDRRSWTQLAAANHFGVSQPTYSRWETGLSRPGNESLPVVADFLHKTPDEVERASISALGRRSPTVDAADIEFHSFLLEIGHVIAWVIDERPDAEDISHAEHIAPGLWEIYRSTASIGETITPQWFLSWCGLFLRQLNAGHSSYRFESGL